MMKVVAVVGMTFHNFGIYTKVEQSSEAIKRGLIAFAQTQGLELTWDTDKAESIWQFYPDEGSYGWGISIPEYQVGTIPGNSQYLDQLSEQLGSPVFLACAFDSDFSLFQLRDSKRDQAWYMVYGQADGMVEGMMGGAEHPDNQVLADYLPEGSTLAEMDRILSKDEVFAEEKVADLLAFLGIGICFDTEVDPDKAYNLAFVPREKGEAPTFQEIKIEFQESNVVIRTENLLEVPGMYSFVGSYFVSGQPLKGLDFLIAGKILEKDTFTFSQVALFRKRYDPKVIRIDGTKGETLLDLLWEKPLEKVQLVGGKTGLAVSFEDFEIAQGKYKDFREGFLKNLNKSFKTLEKDLSPQSFLIKFNVYSEVEATAVLSLHAVPISNTKGQASTLKLITSDPKMGNCYPTIEISQGDIQRYY